MSAFEWGVECAKTGKTVYQNPYGLNSYDWRKWIQGWVSAIGRALTSDEVEMHLKAGW